MAPASRLLKRSQLVGHSCGSHSLTSLTLPLTHSREDAVPPPGLWWTKFSKSWVEKVSNRIH